MPGAYYRLVAEVDENGRFHFTKVNGYSGNNGRAAVFNDRHGAGVFYTAGNAGNGGNPQPAGVITGAGMQIAREADAPLARQADPGGPFPLGSFNITELGQKADKIGKDTNFRGLTVFNNVIYTTKGSGGNGINTVYFIDTTGNAANGESEGVPEREDQGRHGVFQKETGIVTAGARVKIHHCYESDFRNENERPA